MAKSMGRSRMAFAAAAPIAVASGGRQALRIDRTSCVFPAWSVLVTNNRSRIRAVISTPSNTSHDVNHNHRHTAVDRPSSLRPHSLPPPPPPPSSPSSAASPSLTSSPRTTINPTSSPPSSSPSSSSSSAPPPAAPCTPLSGRPALNAALSSHPSNTPIIVLYHARWCRVCKTLRFKLPNVAAQFPSLIWYDVDFAVLDNKSLCNDLNVRLLPTFRLYWGGATDQSHVDDFSTGPFGARRLVEHLNNFLPNKNIDTS